MPKITVNQPNPPTVYTKRYDRFAGVDFSTDPSRIDNSRSPYAVFQSTHPVRGGWIDLPLIGAMPVIAPIRGTNYIIASHALSPVNGYRQSLFLQHLFLIQMFPLNYLLSFGKPHAKAIFLPPVEPGVYFHA